MPLPLTLALSLSFCIACGGCVGSEQPNAPGNGGKADDPVSSIDVRVAPGSDHTLRFDSTGDLTITLFQRDNGALTILELTDRDESSTVDIRYRDEFGREGEATASTSPSVVALDDSGSAREYELTLQNVDEDTFLVGKVVFSQPVETGCIAHERAEYTFVPLATCQVIVAPKLEDESDKTVQSVDFCVGTGQRVDHFDPGVRHDTLHVIGEYVFDDPKRFDDTFTGKLRNPADLEDEGDVLTASYRRSQEVVTFDTDLMGPQEERENREFEYSYTYDLRDDTFEFRVKSRPDIFPNWFWEFAMLLECQPVE